jgi:hypothetical protein
MADYVRKVKLLFKENNCSFVRQGKGDHEIWYSPIVNKNIAIDGNIKKRSSANKTLSQAGITKRV